VSLRLSVLDQAPIRDGSSAREAIAETLELARAADRLGYTRYWLAEHHNSASLSCAAPEILVAQVATVTEKIRVGTGGVMLSHYSPLKVAESFRMLETLHPGRIDLGIGRAPGSDQLTATALAAGPGSLGVEHFPGQIRDLLGFLGDGLDDNHPFRGIRAMPDGPTEPEIWILASSMGSASLAAHFGCPLSFAHFIVQEEASEVLAAYRQSFKPSRRLEKPRASLGVSLMCAPTEQEAYELSLSRYLWWIRIRQGRPGPFPSLEEALDYPFEDDQETMLAKMRRRAVIGNPCQVGARLEEMSEEFGVDEFVVLTICHDPEARKRSYELVAEALDLSPQPRAEAGG